MTDGIIDQISGGQDDVRSILQHIPVDLDRYFARMSRSSSRAG